jgi:glycosyltransferase involved in cell wall biosynthesis
VPYPKITVVTLSLNQARFLESTLLSIRAQEYPNLEHMVIDGGSTDGSLPILERYASGFSYWVSEPDGGITPGLIKGFSRATGDIWCWVNSDDLLEPGALHEVASYFSKDPSARVVYGDATWIDVEGNPIKPKKEHSFSRFIWDYDHNFIPQPSTFWRRELYDEVGGLDPKFQLAMDGDLWARFADVTPLHHVPRLWSRMRSYPEQATQRLYARCLQESIEIRRRHRGDEPAWAVKAKFALAKSTRIARKLAGGCYW